MGLRFPQIFIALHRRNYIGYDNAFETQNGTTSAIIVFSMVGLRCRRPPGGVGKIVLFFCLFVCHAFERQSLGTRRDIAITLF